MENNNVIMNEEVIENTVENVTENVATSGIGGKVVKYGAVAVGGYFLINGLKKGFQWLKGRAKAKKAAKEEEAKKVGSEEFVIKTALDDEEATKDFDSVE